MTTGWAGGVRPWSIVEECEWAVREGQWGVVRGYLERGWELHTSVSSGDDADVAGRGRLSRSVVVRAPANDPSWGECTRLELEVEWIPEHGLDDVLVPIPMSVTNAWLNFDAGTEDSPRPLGQVALPPELGCELCWALAGGGAYDWARQWELRWDTPVGEFDRRIAQIQAGIARGRSARERIELTEAANGLVLLKLAAGVQQSAQD